MCLRSRPPNAAHRKATNQGAASSFVTDDDDDDDDDAISTNNDARMRFSTGNRGDRLLMVCFVNALKNRLIDKKLNDLISCTIPQRD